MKMPKVAGFQEHLNIERRVILDIKERQEEREYRPSVLNGRKSPEKVFRFFENPGAIELFSINEATHLFDNAASIYGDDKSRYAKNKLQDAGARGNRRSLKKAPAVSLISALRSTFPNFSNVIDLIEGAAALSHLTNTSHFYFPPLLLVGPPGVGKTVFCQTIGKIANIDFKRIDIGMYSTSASLVGLSFTWSTGQCGEIFNNLVNCDHANPIIMLDEIDKARGNSNAPIDPALLCLLERENAKHFKDEGILLSIDASHINWVATANHIDWISDAVLSRLTIAEVSPPTIAQCEQIAVNIYNSIRKEYSWGDKFDQDIKPSVLEILRTMSPREIGNQLRQAFGKAALAKRHQITCEDIQTRRKPTKVKMGFI